MKYVGEGLTFVVAETLDAARDGAEAIAFDIEPLPVLFNPERALDADSPRIHEDAANLCPGSRSGDFEAVAEAVTRAAHVTRQGVWGMWVLGIFSADYLVDWYALRSRAMGLDYRFLIADCRDAWRKHFSMDADALERTVSAMLDGSTSDASNAA